MPVVRLEIDIPDYAAAAGVAGQLTAAYATPNSGPWTGARVEVIPDDTITRNRVILAAAGYFLGAR